MTEDTPLWQLGARALADKTRSGEVSAVEAVAASVERVQDTNAHLNAIVDDLSDQALEEAEALDAEFARRGPRGPLHGLPVTIKVNVDQKGRATTNGVTAFKDVIAPDDAPLVKALRRAGAVPIGRTNTPEFSFRATTVNPLHGRTMNPWNDELSPGGSSGGASSAVMAGMGVLAHGNDIGGSLRFPAYCCGAATVKPGLGRVPAYNPSAPAERGLMAQLMSVQGLIGREVRDVRLGLETLTLHDPRDPWHVPISFYGPPEPGPIKVAFTKDTFEFPLSPAVSTALDQAAEALSAAGYDLVEIQPPNLREIAEEANRVLFGETLEMLGDQIEQYGSTQIRAIFDNYAQLFKPYEGAALQQAMAGRTRYLRQWTAFLARYPLVLTPFLPTPPFRWNRDEEGLEGVREVLGAAIWSYSMNFMGLPAGNVPAHFDPVSGMPIGVQIVGRRFREDLILDACEAVERRAGVMAKRLFQRMDMVPA